MRVAHVKKKLSAPMEWDNVSIMSMREPAQHKKQTTHHCKHNVNIPLGK